MTHQALAARYLAALEAGDAAAVAAMFAADGTVVSPLYGTMAARAFYEGLFADTGRSRTALLTVFGAAEDAEKMALHFRYDWTLSDGTEVAFEVVDVFTFAPDGRFQTMTIIYDTAPLREHVAALRRS